MNDLLKKFPIPDDDDDRFKIALIVGVASFALGWLLSEIISQAIFGIAVFVCFSAALEWEKQRNPNKYPQGFFGFGSAYDDVGLGVIAAIVIAVAAYLNLYLIAVTLTIVALFAFMEIEAIRRDSEYHSRRDGSRRY